MGESQGRNAPEAHSEEQERAHRDHQPAHNSSISWREHETKAKRKSGDWYFLLWITALAGAAIAVILENILFALLLVLSAFTLSVTVSKRPKEVAFEVSKRGVTADTVFLPYASLSAFCVIELETGDAFLVLEPSKPLGTRRVFPIAPDVDLDELREFLLDHLKEEELDIPLSDKIADSLGV